jgi:outer membrane protein insertion porin family
MARDLQPQRGYPASTRWARTTRGLVLAAGMLVTIGAAQAESAKVAGTTVVQPVPENQPSPTPEMKDFEGRPIRAISLLSVPAVDRNAKATDPAPQPSAADAEIVALIRNQLRLKEQAPFSQKAVSEDISRLNRLGRFSQVESRVRLMSDGSVELIYLVTLQPLIEDIQPVGNKLLSDEEIQKAVGALVGTPFDQSLLDRTARRIEEQYRRRGYYNARVGVDQTELAGTGIVLLRVREGEKTRITDVRFEGAQSFTTRQLRGAIKTTAVNLLELIRPENSTVDDDRFAEDVGSLIQYYKDRGYLDVRADRVVTPSPNGREAIITFVIDEGAVYTLRSVKVVYEANAERIISEEQLQGLIDLKPGDVYNDSKLRKAAEAMRDAYGRLGYADATITRRQLRSPDAPVVDMLLEVREGRQFITGTISVQGNSITRDDVVRRNITVQPGRPLDAVAVRDSERRLNQVRLFAPRSQTQSGPRVTVQPERSDEPGVRDIIAEVEETNTGSFNIGAAVNSDSGLVGQLVIRQSNFDIQDTPDSWGELVKGEAFRGGGQTLTLALQPGTQVSRYELGLSEPYLFDTDFSGSASVFFFQREYRAYREERYGTRMGIGRRLGDRWSIDVPLRLEQIRLPQIDAEAPTDFFLVKDPRFHATTGLNLVRTSVDDQTYPSKGTRIQFGFDQTLGDDTFTTFKAEYARYFAINEDALGRKVTLEFRSSVQYIPNSNTDVPFYDRLYLGGQSFRGFGLRGIGPVGKRADTGGVGEQIGGNFLIFNGLELKYPIYEQLLAGVVFLDTGTIESDIGISSYRASIGLGLRVYVPQISGAPLAFDFGFPVIKEDTDRKRLFNFSLDIPFR